jgi:hypothetical protein
MKTIPRIAGLFLPIVLGACHKPAAENDASPADTPAPVAIVKSAPASTAPAATPLAINQPAATIHAPAAAPRELAPAGVFYLLAAARIETDSGVTGLPPGTGVKLLHDDLYLTPAGQAHLRADQLTNDMTLARQALASERARQAGAAARVAADGKIIDARNRAETTGSTPAPWLLSNQPPAPSATAPPAPNALAPPASNGSAFTNTLNSTHSSTKDKVYKDQYGREYWKDTQGHIQYF